MLQAYKTPQLEPVWMSSWNLIFWGVQGCVIAAETSVLYIAYLWVHSLATLLYLEKRKSEWVSKKRLTDLKLFHMPNSFAFILTFVYLICRCEQCLGLVDHQDLGHIARSIWIIKLGQKKDQKSACSHVSIKLKTSFSTC